MTRDRREAVAIPGGGSRLLSLAVIGLGLIGGSLAWAATRSGGFERVVGYDADPVVTRLAAERGIAVAAPCLKEAVERADLVVIATPPLTVAGVIAAATACCRPGTVITDVAGFKRDLRDRLSSGLPAGVTYVGGHPMAGSERQGLGAARADLFQGAPYIIVPPPQGRGSFTEPVERLVEAIGARPVYLDAGDHDRLVALLSHLPYLLAAGLCLEAEALGDQAAEIAAGGFRDATRVAAGPPEMGVGMCLGNRAEVAGAWDRLKTTVDRLVGRLAAGDEPGLRSETERAQAFRAGLNGEGRVGR